MNVIAIDFISSIIKLKANIMPNFKSPGVYINKIPFSVTSVKTAIPAFIGYTHKAKNNKAGDLTNKPRRIESIREYEKYFGGPQPETGIAITISTSRPGAAVRGKLSEPSNYLMYHSLEMFFNNGGGACYIVSVGDYSNGGIINHAELQSGLNEIAKIDEITLILFPDSLNISNATNYYSLHKEALLQAAELRDRFVVMDVWTAPDESVDSIQVLRDFDFGTVNTSKYGAVYYPAIVTPLNYTYDEGDVEIIGTEDKLLHGSLKALKAKNYDYYLSARKAIENIEKIMPASPAIAGKYAESDNTRGVWKAPANIDLDYVSRPVRVITDRQQETLTVDNRSGKSINTIRSFPGRGPAVIWGARTLAGNDPQWKYIQVVRFFMMVEASVKNGINPFIDKPNDKNTWTSIKSMIENYLQLQLKAGALAGTSPKKAYFVKIGLGETMTKEDVSEDRLIIEIGMAVIRPSEFIILRLMQQMQQTA